MERLTRPDVDVTEYAAKFLNPRLKGKEIDWKRTNDAGIDLLINAITCDELSKDVFRQMARDLYGRLKAYEDTGLSPEEVPTVDVAPVVHGRWRDNGIAGSVLVKCTVCGFDCGASSFFYCPKCGAKMDGGTEK